MDPAIVGALIGLSILGCVVLTTVCYEKGSRLKETIVRKWKERRHIHAPLLPMVNKNPVLVRSGSRQFQMKELLASK